MIIPGNYEGAMIAAGLKAAAGNRPSCLLFQRDKGHRAFSQHGTGHVFSVDHDFFGCFFGNPRYGSGFTQCHDLACFCVMYTFDSRKSCIFVCQAKADTVPFDRKYHVPAIAAAFKRTCGGFIAADKAV